LAAFLGLAVAFVSFSNGHAESLRPDVTLLPVPSGATREQLVLGDRIFHGEAAAGKCYECHGWDAKGTANGNDFTVGSLIWGDSLEMIKRTLHHNIEIAPGRDGDLTDSDVDAVAVYVWALVHQERFIQQKPN
jgi:mono/diheme cytochrome c family protein